jgi:tetratricopeptide (TPR) repeat protein
MPRSAELLEEGRRYEGHGVLDRALESYVRAAEETSEPSIVAEALTHQSRVHRCRSEWEAALTTAQRAQEIATAANLDAALVDASIAEGNVLICRGDFPEALAIFRRLVDTSSDARVRGIALQNIGSILWQQGQLGAAERALSESLGWFQRAGYRLGEAIALNNHGRITLERGNAELAKQLLGQARLAARAIEDAELTALVGLNYAAALDADGDHRGAIQEASTALGYFRSSGNRWREIECLRLIGAVSERLGDRDDAVRCHEHALNIAEEIGARQDVRVISEFLSRVGHGVPRGRGGGTAHQERSVDGNVRPAPPPA